MDVSITYGGILAHPTFCIVYFCIDGPCLLLYVLLLQCKICDMLICTFHVLMHIHVRTCMYLYDLYVQIHNLHWMDLLLTHPLWQCGLPWTRWHREGASWQCSHPLQVYNLKSTQQVSARARTEYNRTVVHQATHCVPELLLGTGVAVDTPFLLQAVEGSCTLWLSSLTTARIKRFH